MVTGLNEEAAWLEAKEKTEKSLAAMQSMLLDGLPRLTDTTTYLQSVENRRTKDAVQSDSKSSDQDDNACTVRVSKC
jgi:hypothetical protein